MNIIDLQNRVNELVEKINNIEVEKIRVNINSLANYHELNKSLDMVEENVDKLLNDYQYSPKEIKKIEEEVMEEKEAQEMLRELAPYYFVYKIMKNKDN